MKKLTLSLLLAGLLSAATIPAFAGGIVFDPQNYAVNTVQATAAAHTEAEAIMQTIHQFNQLKSMYQNLKRLGGEVTAADYNRVVDDLRSLEAYRIANEGVEKALGGQGDFITTLQRSYVNDGYKNGGGGRFVDYLPTLAKRAAAGDLKARELFDLAQTVGKNVETANQRRMKLQEQNASNEGVMQAAQTTNEYLDTLVSQNQNIQQLLAEQVQTLAEQKAIQAAQNQSSVDKAKDQARREKEALDSFSERWKVKK